METYRIINRELSINNQELRNAINKLKHEVTYLNNQLFEQREQFIRLKESIASAIEKQYHMTMAIIFPEKKQTKSPNRMDFIYHRRSCNNVTVANSLKNTFLSPPVKSPQKELNVNSVAILPNFVSQRGSRKRRSPRKSESPKQGVNALALEIHIDSPEDQGYQNSPITSQTSANNSLLTINEEESNATDSRDETLTDATINNLLDAPCSTPYNCNKIASDMMQGTREIRVLVQKLNFEQLMRSSKNKTPSITILRDRVENESNCKTPNKLQYDGSRSDDMALQINFEQNINKKTSKPTIKKKKLKENIDSESESNYSGDDSNSKNTSTKTLRPKRKAISLQEPNLKKKLRNTSNMKL